MVVSCSPKIAIVVFARHAHDLDFCLSILHALVKDSKHRVGTAREKIKLHLLSIVFDGNDELENLHIFTNLRRASFNMTSTLKMSIYFNERYAFVLKHTCINN